MFRFVNLVILLAFLKPNFAFGIDFKTVNLTYANGTEFQASNILAIEFVPDSSSQLLLVGTFDGAIRLLGINHASPFRYVCRDITSTKVPNGRSVLGITADPFTPNTFFVVASIPAYTFQGFPLEDWDNGQILVLKLVQNKRLEFLPDPLITGLPVGNTTMGNGVYAVAVAPDGGLLISQGLHTNIGVPSPPDFQEDSYYSGAFLKADVRTPGKTLAVDWDSKVITEARPKNEHKSGISLYATGFKTVLNPVISTRGDLFVCDNGGEPELGPKSISCTDSVPIFKSEPDRFIRVREGRWYGSANRVRGSENPAFCVNIWGTEDNLTDILESFPGFTPPILTTAKPINENILGSGTFGFLQYLANWFPYLRKKFIGTGYDLLEPLPGKPLPIMFGIDLWNERFFKIADAPGLVPATDVYGSVFVGQFTIGKIAIAIPVVKNWMKRQASIRNVWPNRGKPGSTVVILGTSLPNRAIRIGGRKCPIGSRRKYFRDVIMISCKVPTLSSYSKTASSVRIGNISLDEAFTVLPPNIKLAVEW